MGRSLPMGKGLGCTADSAVWVAFRRQVSDELAQQVRDFEPRQDGLHGWSPISGPPGIRARLLLIWILVDVAGYGVMGVAALGSVFGRSAITQR